MQADSYENIYGWLAPDGKLYACDYAHHYEKAKAIVAELMDALPMARQAMQPDSLLERLGWYHMDRYGFRPEPRRVTAAQWEAAYEMIEYAKREHEFAATQLTAQLNAADVA